MHLTCTIFYLAFLIKIPIQEIKKISIKNRTHKKSMGAWRKYEDKYTRSFSSDRFPMKSPSLHQSIIPQCCEFPGAEMTLILLYEVPNNWK